MKIDRLKYFPAAVVLSALFIAGCDDTQPVDVPRDQEQQQENGDTGDDNGGEGGGGDEDDNGGQNDDDTDDGGNDADY